MGSDTAERNRQRGVAFHDAGDFAGALAAYDTALRADPLAATIHFHRGNAPVMLRRFEDGIVMKKRWSASRALALKPDDARALYNAGNIPLPDESGAA